MIKKNVEIEKLGINGEGVTHIDGKICFVKGALPKDIVDIKIKKDKKKFIEAELISIREASSHRIVPKCEFYESCGGCNLQHLEYVKQLEYKKQLLEETLMHVAGVDVKADKIVGSLSNYGYRNKMNFLVAKVDGKTTLGMQQEGTNTLVEIDKCIISNEKINEVLDIVKEYINKHNIEAYDYDNKQGFLRNVVVRALDNAILVTLVTADKNIPNLNNLSNMLTRVGTFGLDININKAGKGKIFSNKFIHISGIDKLYGMEDGVRYPVSSHSFMQINDYIKDKIYTEIEESIHKDNIVIDAYSGAGLLSHILAKRCKYVYAVEIIESAVNDSKELSLDNGIKNIESICADVKDVLPKLVKGKDKDKMTIVLDPPRIGCDKEVIDTILKSGVKHIVYVSCNPATLARDIKLLKDKYKITKLIPYDMFPNTKHIETLVCLQRLV